jgi:polygalacturonase
MKCAVFIGILSLHLVHAAAVFDIRQYGAVGDGVTVNTMAIEKAVQAANLDYLARGGGSGSTVPPSHVVVTDGTYATGQVNLLSGVYLELAESGTLLAVMDRRQFPVDPNAWGVVYAHNVANIGIVGEGRIDGNWTNYIVSNDAVNIEFIAHGWPGCAGNTTNDCRPMLVKFFNSTDIVVDGITMVGSPFWTFHLWNCSRVTVSQLTQLGDPRFPNNDGIDIDSSQHVLVQDSSFDTADDGICIKSSSGMQVTPSQSIINITSFINRLRLKGCLCELSHRPLRGFVLSAAGYVQHHSATGECAQSQQCHQVRKHDAHRYSRLAL